MELVRVLVVLAAQILAVAPAPPADSRRLYERLLQEIERRNNSPLVPPLLPGFAAIPVEIRFRLNRIVRLDAASATLTMSAGVELLWTDSRLAWNANASGVPFLLLPPARLWVPPVELSGSPNFAEQFADFSSLDAVRVRPDGLAQLHRALTFDVRCHLDVHYFPWDVQCCRLDILPAPALRGVMTPVAHRGTNWTGDQLFSEEWDLRAARHRVRPRPKADIGGGVVDVRVYEVTLLLARHSIFYVLTLVIPSVMLALVTLVPYAMPPAHSGQKLLIPVNAFVSFNIYMLLIERSLPKASVMPIIGKYYAVLLAVAAVTEIMQSISIKFYGCHLKRIPRPLAFFYFRVLHYLFCVGACHGAHDLYPADGPEDDKAEQVRKRWQTMGRINDRAGLFICSFIILVVFLYLFAACHTHRVSVEELLRQGASPAACEVAIL